MHINCIKFRKVYSTHHPNWEYEEVEMVKYTYYVSYTEEKLSDEEKLDSFRNWKKIHKEHPDKVKTDWFNISKNRVIAILGDALTESQSKR